MALAGAGTTTSWTNGWSSQAKILPFLEQGTIYNSANFSIWKEDPVNTTVILLTVPTLICPSEINATPLTHDYGLSGVINYGACMGDWFVWAGFSGSPRNRRTEAGGWQSSPMA